jgi:hypothetical protein
VFVGTVTALVAARAGFALGRLTSSTPTAPKQSSHAAAPTQHFFENRHSASTTTTALPSTRSRTPVARGNLPITVESDTQMQEEGNNGPTSSVLLPVSCQLAGNTVTAKGTSQGVSEAYDRYGDIVVLYLFTAPSSGYPQGAQLAVSSSNQSPPLGGSGWQVSTTFNHSVGEPARCLIAAQPTHDEQLAP